MFTPNSNWFPDIMTPDWVRGYIGDNNAMVTNDYLKWVQNLLPDLVLSLAIIFAVVGIWWLVRRVFRWERERVYEVRAAVRLEERLADIREKE